MNQRSFIATVRYEILANDYCYEEQDNAADDFSDGHYHL